MNKLYFYPIKYSDLKAEFDQCEELITGTLLACKDDYPKFKLTGPQKLKFMSDYMSALDLIERITEEFNEAYENYDFRKMGEINHECFFPVHKIIHNLRFR